MTTSEPASPERCEELREALASARARLVPPRDAGFTESSTASVEMPAPTTDAPGDYDAEADIARLEQALREAGCEEED